MPKIRISIRTTDAPVVSGQPFSGKYLFKLGEAAQILPATTADFDLPADGTYAISCQSLDASGSPINDTVSDNITLVGGALAPVDGGGGDTGPQTYPAPAAISATILAD